MSYRKEEQFFMKEMEWGVNSLTNTTYMNYEFDIDIEFNEACNASCVYCPVSINPRRKNKHMSLEDSDSIFKMLVGESYSPSLYFYKGNYFSLSSSWRNNFNISTFNKCFKC